MLTAEEEAQIADLLAKVKEIEDLARARYVVQAAEETYSFVAIASPKDRATIVHFQRVFGAYIPLLVEDEDATIRLHQRLMDSLFTNPPETINRSTLETDVKRFRKAIKTLTDWPIWGTKPCIAAVERPPNVWDPQNPAHVAREIYDCLLALGDAERHYKNLPEVIQELEGWARRAAQRLPDRRNINWEAVHAVSCLHRFWESWAEIPAPRKALNPTSPFANYLRDAFAFFCIAGDPIGAFKRWAALKKTESGTSK
ncbi:hypothetical protein [Mesorhizobium marinum]|uniref:hypothetical protein n=1 Tax=Mesorhizobium marinum TaxID=3228790 RepID=UPI003465CCFF